MNLCTGLFKMIVEVLTTCHTQYTWDRSICIFLCNRTTLQVFTTYLTGALYVCTLWFYNCVWQVVKTPTINFNKNDCQGFNNLSYTIV